MKSAKHSCKSITTSLFVILRQFGLFAEYLDGFLQVLPVALRTIAAVSPSSATCSVVRPRFLGNEAILDVWGTRARMTYRVFDAFLRALEMATITYRGIAQ